MNNPTERPISFNVEEVRALLEGRKTQTRRPVKPQPVSPGVGAYFDAYNGGPQWNWWAPDNKQYLTQIINCPLGKPGDLLWVRETWRLGDNPGSENANDVHYRADEDECSGGPWRSLSTMPKWAARIWLRNKSVRVERVQCIGEEDAFAEGVSPCWVADLTPQGMEREGPSHAYTAGFMEMWHGIYAAKGYGWAGNPWAWVGEFERTER